MTHYPVVNLLIDLQFGTLLHMRSDAQRDYLQAVESALSDLRKKGVPTIWVTINENLALHRPLVTGPSTEVRDAGMLTRVGFFTHEEQTTESDFAYFSQWLERMGPRVDEAILEKKHFNAFDKKGTLTNYLNEMGTSAITLMGGHADVCVLETAMGVAKNDFHATILSDLVMGYSDLDWTKSADDYKFAISHDLEKFLRLENYFLQPPPHSTKFTLQDKEKIQNAVGIFLFGQVFPQDPAHAKKASPATPGIKSSATS